MASKPQRLINQFAAFSGDGKVQSEHNVPLDNATLNTRDKCEIPEDVVARRVILDCENRYVDDEVTDTRPKRFTFTYAIVTAQILARWAAYFFGSSITAPTGTPANEAQTLARTGTVTGGTFTITFALEGRTGITAAIPWNGGAAQIAVALVKQTFNHRQSN